MMNSTGSMANPQGGPAERGTEAAGTAIAPGEPLSPPTNVDASRYRFDGLLLFRR